MERISHVSTHIKGIHDQLYITKKELESIFLHAWCKETSMDPDCRSTDIPDRVQCMPTTFVVESLLGGEMYVERFLMTNKTTRQTKKIPHFFNIVNDINVDFTRNQMQYRELMKNIQAKKIGKPIVLKNQNKQDYYAFFAESGIQKKEKILFENVRKNILESWHLDISTYLSTGKKITLLE